MCWASIPIPVIKNHCINNTVGFIGATEFPMEIYVDRQVNVYFQKSMR